MVYDFNQPNPDDRRDNEEKLKQAVQNTAANINEANDTIKRTSEPQKAHIQAKNERRKTAMEAMNREIEDEE